jgi:DNA-binding Lrp family transcriptional regulator
MAARYSLRSVAHALVLIKAERGSLATLGGELAEVEGVSEAFSVTGEWDFVAIVRVPRLEELNDVVTDRIARLSGIEDTYTMVAFETYSRHDLEAMFSIGQ